MRKSKIGIMAQGFVHLFLYRWAVYLPLLFNVQSIFGADNA